MLTIEENDFINYWEANREKERMFFRQLGYGLPRGLIFGLPILLAVIFHDWYKNMIPISKAQIILISIAVIGISLFYSIFRMNFRWDQNEQLYKELKLKEKKGELVNL
ncbi:MAG: hypothetical protein ABI208_06030 [Ginsengibacter sp.]|jgi:predicted permease